MKDTLPPLPPSDQTSLDYNRFDGYYKVKARDFWGENEINRIEVPETKCDHEFRPSPEGAVCTKCNFGLFGRFEIKDGKLFHNGDPLGL